MTIHKMLKDLGAEFTERGVLRNKNDAKIEALQKSNEAISRRPGWIELFVEPLAEKMMKKNAGNCLLLGGKIKKKCQDNLPIAYLSSLRNCTILITDMNYVLYGMASMEYMERIFIADMILIWQPNSLMK